MIMITEPVKVKQIALAHVTEKSTIATAGFWVHRVP